MTKPKAVAPVKEDDVLRRMLAMPPKPHVPKAPAAKKKSKPAK